MRTLLIVGGSDAGVMAALRARQLDAEIQVTMALTDRYPNFSICGLPFFVSREVEDWQALAHRTVDEIRRHRIQLLVEHVATRIDPAAKHVILRDRAGHERAEKYDTAIIATGARPRTEGVHGIDSPAVYPLHTMEDSFRVRERIDAGGVNQAVIVGAGYIGLEMADAFAHRGLRVTIVSRPASVMPTIDEALGEVVRDELERHGVEVVTGVDVAEISEQDGASKCEARADCADIPISCWSAEVFSRTLTIT